MNRVNLSDEGNKTVRTSLKVVLLGDLGVGKTCLRSQFVHHIFTNAYKATIGGDYLTASVLVEKEEDAEVEVGGDQNGARDEETELLSDAVKQGTTKIKTQVKVNLQIWDTAGQERFNSISQAFCRGADVVVLVYDICNYESVIHLQEWFGWFLEHCHVERPRVVVVGNKIDRAGDRCVDKDEIPGILDSGAENGNGVHQYIRDWETDLLEVSSRKYDLVEKVFQTVAKLGYQASTALSSSETRPRHMMGFDTIDLNDTYTESSGASRCSC